MSVTTTFRKQHEELLAIAGQIGELIEEGDHARDSSAMVDLLGVLGSKLSGHLSLEDRILYPRLLSHETESVRETAQAFVDEMGEIAAVFANYKKTWNAGTIQAEPGRFSRETAELLDALATRIEREDNDLYELMDSIGD